MAKRARITNPEKWIKEGRGSGIGADYKPWLIIQDVSSEGRSSRLKGIKTRRQHDFLSDLETNYFYLTEYSDFVFDIREQYPLLPFEETIVIAEELGIKHPTIQKTNEPYVMTTDFLLTVDKGDGFVELARTVKMKDELLDERVIEKFEIERVYWERRGIDWGIVTESEIHQQMARNIGYSHEHYDIQKYDAFQNMNQQHIEDLAIMFLQRIIQTTSSIRETATLFDKDTHMPLGSGLTLFYHLIARKVIIIDLLNYLDLEKPPIIQSINEHKLEKVKYG